MKKEDAVMNVMLPKELREKIKGYCKEHDVTFSATTRRVWRRMITEAESKDQATIDRNNVDSLFNKN